MDINWNTVRAGDKFHTGKATIEISRPIRAALDPDTQREYSEIWAFRGDLLGEIDYNEEYQYKEHEVLEALTPAVIKKYLRSGPQYKEGLQVLLDDMTEFMRDKAFAWHEDKTREAILDLVTKYEQRLQRNGWPS